MTFTMVLYDLPCKKVHLEIIRQLDFKLILFIFFNYFFINKFKICQLSL